MQYNGTWCQSLLVRKTVRERNAIRKKCREPNENATNFDNETPVSRFLGDR